MAKGREKLSPGATSRRISPARRKMGCRLGPWWPRSQAQPMSLPLHLPLHPFLLSLGDMRAYGRRSSSLSLSWLLDTPDMGLGDVLAPHVSLAHSSEDAAKGLLTLSCWSRPQPGRQMCFPGLEVKHLYIAQRHPDPSSIPHLLPFPPGPPWPETGGRCLVAPPLPASLTEPSVPSHPSPQPCQRSWRSSHSPPPRLPQTCGFSSRSFGARQVPVQQEATV